jgi:glycosyltransferase involved in cell wall biosynthesis
MTNGHRDPAVLPDSPLISVVIPAYNAAAFLPQTLSHVLDQTHRLLECIVVDDGSTDSTPDVVAAMRDPRVRYVRQENRGVAAARNAGVSAALGQLVALLDADDLWLPRKLEVELAALRAVSSAAFAVTPYVICDDRAVVHGVVKVKDVAAALHSWLMLEGNGLALSSTALAHRSVFECCGGFDEALSTSADLDWAVRVGRHHQLVTAREPLVLYRQHAAQMHLGLAAYEHDVRQLFDRHLKDPRELRRAEANFHVRLAAGHAGARRWREAGRQVHLAGRLNPSRILSLPASALVRRSLRRIRRRLDAAGIERQARLC